MRVFDITCVWLIEPGPSYTVSLQWLQPKLDGKRSFIADSFLRHPYIDILITTKIFHRVLFEKVCPLEAENSLSQMHSFFVKIYALKACRLSYVTLMCKIVPVVIIIFQLLFDVRPPWAAEISTIKHLNNFINWAVVGVLVRYEITRGTKLVVGRVTERV